MKNIALVYRVQTSVMVQFTIHPLHILRGHGGATRRPEQATRWRRWRRRRLHNCKKAKTQLNETAETTLKCLGNVLEWFQDTEKHANANRVQHVSAHFLKSISDALWIYDHWFLSTGGVLVIMSLRTIYVVYKSSTYIPKKRGRRRDLVHCSDISLWFLMIRQLHTILRTTQDLRSLKPQHHKHNYTGC